MKNENMKKIGFATAFAMSFLRHTDAKPILAKFTNRNDTIEYATEILDLLCTGNYIEWIIDGETGELIFDKGEKYVDNDYKYLAKYF